jgi:uncharacterized protein YggE
VENTNNTATDALALNSNNTLAVLSALTALGINDKTDIKTLSFSVTPQYKSVYNNDTKNYDSIFQGYMVSNNLRVTSLQKDLAGKLIDAAVRGGATVTGVNFDVTEDLEKTTKMNLIKAAIDNCNTQYKNALDPIGYKSIGYQSINIRDMQPITPRSIQISAFANANSGAQIFPGQITIRIKIDIISIISKV